MALIIENLSLKRGNRLLIKDLNFSLKKGESLLLTGPNGVGKTTLIRAIAGYITPSKGHITFNNHLTPENKHTPDAAESQSQDNDFQQQIHYIGHKNGIRSSLTVLENLEFWQQFQGGATPLRSVIETYYLESLINIPAGYLSAGQKRRLGLARLALSKRQIWLLDEPTVSLDEMSTNLIATAATQHLNQGGILIAATHIPLEIPFNHHIKLERQLEQEWEDI